VCKRNLIKVLGICLEQWRTLRKFVDGILEIFIGSLFVDDDKTHIQPVAKFEEEKARPAISSVRVNPKIAKFQEQQKKLKSQPLGFYSNKTWQQKKKGATGSDSRMEYRKST
jgi:hypothetical protein